MGSMREGNCRSRRMASSTLRSALLAVKGVAFDFDGVFTDNRVWVSDDGHETVVCWRSDGLGLARLRKLDIPLAILSTEKNPVVSRRATKLKLTCIQGLDDKAAAFTELAAAHGLTPSDFAFVGNDVNDAECLAMAGLAVVPADASPSVVPLAHLVLNAMGGRGAVREFCDRVCDARLTAPRRRPAGSNKTLKDGQT